MKFLRSVLPVSLFILTAALSPAANLVWTNTSGGNWNTAANWSPNTIPGAGDNANITNSGSYTVTLDVDATVGSLTLGGSSETQTFSASSSTFTLNGASTINGNGVMTLNSSTLGGTGTLTSLGTISNNNSTINAGLVNQGLLVFRGFNNNLGGSFVNQAGATVRLLGEDTLGQTIVNVALGFTNSGVIELTSAVIGQNTALNVSAGSLVNAAGGQLNVLAGAGGPRGLGAQLDNRGTVTINQALALNGSSSAHLNSGTISLSGGDFTINQNGNAPSFTTTGTMDIPSGRTLTVSGGTFNYNAGTVGGAGTLNLSSTTANFTPDFSNATTTLRLAGTTLNGPGKVTNAAGRTLNTDNSAINAALVNQGLLVFRGFNNNLGGSFVNQAGATVRLLGEDTLGQAIVNVALGFTNSGVIELTSAVIGQNTALNVSAGSLVNAAGGQLNVLAGAGGPRGLGAQLDNRGTVTINQALALNGSSSAHLNSGTISLSGGDFTINQNGNAPSFTTTGTMDIPSGRTLTVSGGTFNYNAGTVGGAGTLNLSSTTANFTPDFSNATTTLRLASTTLNGPGKVTNAAGRTLNTDNSAINAALVNQGLLVFRGFNNNLGGSFANQAGATVRLLGEDTLGQAILNVALGFTNSGVIELTSAVLGQNTALNVSAGSLVNAAGGQLNVLAGAGGPRGLGAQLDNRGTVTINQALALNGSSSAHLNSGTISLSGGDFTINQNGNAPSFTTTGTMDIPSGRTLTVSGGTFNYNAGTVGGAGTLNLSSTTANFTPDFSNATTTLRLAGTTLNGPGKVTNAAGRTLNTDNSAINAALVNQGLLVFRGFNNNLGGSFVNQAGATVRLLGEDTLGQTIVNVALGFTNSGVIELTSAVIGQNTALNVSAGSLVNAAGGQLNVLAGAGGPRGLGVQLDNRGTVTINQALALNGSSSAHLNSGTISLSGGDFTINQNGNAPSFTTTGTMDIPSGRTLTVSGGTFNYNAGTVGGAGTLNLSSTTANFTPDFSNATTTLRLAGTTLNGPGKVTNAAGRTLNTDNSAINAALVNQGLLVFRGFNNNLGGSFVNQAGATVRLLGEDTLGQTIVNVALGFTNSGVIELTSAVIGQNTALNVSAGSLVNAAGGQLNVLAGAGGPRGLGVQLDNRGTVTINQALALNGSSSAHLNSGTISLSGGDFTINQNGNAPSFTTTGTITIPSNRTLTVSGGTFVNGVTGTLQGSGTFDVRTSTFTNAGNVNPGTSPGILTVLGNFPQTAAGSLNIEIGGRTAGVDYDQLNIGGLATLNGTLNIQLTNGFQPSGGDSFEIIRHNSGTGFFDHMVGLNIGGGLLFQPVFSATNIVLTVLDTRPRLVFQSARRLPGGQIEFDLAGTAGQDFVIEATTNISPAVWSPVLTNTNAGAVFKFIVTDAANFPVRFFRTRQ